MTEKDLGWCDWLTQVGEDGGEGGGREGRREGEEEEEEYTERKDFTRNDLVLSLHVEWL